MELLCYWSFSDVNLICPRQDSKNYPTRFVKSLISYSDNSNDWYSVGENKKLNNTGYVHSPAVGRQKLLLVNLTTTGVPLVPMFFCQWYIVRV